MENKREEMTSYTIVILYILHIFKYIFIQINIFSIYYLIFIYLLYDPIFIAINKN